MDFEPFCKLRDHRNRSFTLLGLWLLNVTTPVGLRNAKLVSVVIFPAKAAQFSLAHTGVRGGGDKRRRRFRQYVEHLSDLIKRISVSVFRRLRLRKNHITHRVF